jgi:hypothetical protein
MADRFSPRAGISTEKEMDISYPEQEIDAFLFGNGLTVDDYFMDGEVIGYKSANGREFDLLMDHEFFAAACRARLIELGVGRRP